MWSYLASVVLGVAFFAALNEARRNWKLAGSISNLAADMGVAIIFLVLCGLVLFHAING